MKLMKQGRAQKGWAKEFVCTGAGNGGGGCNAILLVEQNDVFRTESHHYDGSSESYNTFKCMTCGVWTDIKERIPFKPRPKKPEDSNV